MPEYNPYDLLPVEEVKRRAQEAITGGWGYHQAFCKLKGQYYFGVAHPYISESLVKDLYMTWQEQFALNPIWGWLTIQPGKDRAIILVTVDSGNLPNPANVDQDQIRSELLNLLNLPRTSSSQKYWAYKWLYLPEDSRFLFLPWDQYTSHGMIADKYFGDKAMDKNGWNSWWGGVFQNLKGSPTWSYSVNYTPLSVAKSYDPAAHLPPELKEKLDRKVQELNAEGYFPNG
jgi:hypothetical protein